MRKLAAAAAAIALLASTGAEAADWQPAGLADDTLLGVEVTSIEVKNNIRTAPIIFAFGHARITDLQVDYMVATVELDCIRHVGGLLQMSSYKADGTHLLTVDNPDPPSAIQPESLMGFAEEMICDGRRDPAGFTRAIDFAEAGRRMLLEETAH